MTLRTGFVSFLRLRQVQTELVTALRRWKTIHAWTIPGLGLGLRAASTDTVNGGNSPRKQRTRAGGRTASSSSTLIDALARRASSARRFSAGQRTRPEAPAKRAPEMASRRQWWEILEFDAGPPARAEIMEARFRSLASHAHPDKGGSAARMQALNRARSEAREYYARQIQRDDPARN